MSTQRQKGTSWETAIVGYLRESGAVHAERRAGNGAADRGDITGLPGVVIEAKSCARTELAAWLDEADRERVNAAADVGLVWFKRRGRTSPGAGFVLMSGEQAVRLLAAAGYVPGPSTQESGTRRSEDGTRPPGAGER